MKIQMLTADGLSEYTEYFFLLVTYIKKKWVSLKFKQHSIGGICPLGLYFAKKSNLSRYSRVLHAIPVPSSHFIAAFYWQTPLI